MTYAEIKVKKAELQAEMKNTVQTYFNEETKKFFEANPEVESFGWKQYTPYFNDGDTCEFGVSSDADSVEVNGVQGYDVDIIANWQQKDLYKAERESKLKSHEAVQDLIQSIDEDDLKTLFGDHARITVKRDGTVDNEDYEHD